MTRAYYRRREHLRKNYAASLGSVSPSGAIASARRQASVYVLRTILVGAARRAVLPLHDGRECHQLRSFEYVPNGLQATFSLRHRVHESLAIFPIGGGAETRLTADAYVLACGTPSTSNLILRSVYKSRGRSSGSRG